MPIINALPPFNIISNFAKNINKPKELIQSNIKSSKESLATAGSAAGVVGAAIAAPYVAPSVAKYVTSNPLKSIGIGAGALVGGAAIAENPKIAIQAPSKTVSALTDLGTTAGKVSKSGSFGESYGHLKSYVQEHPIATGIGVGAIGLTAIKGLFPAIATAQQTSAIKEQTQAYQSYTAGLETAAAGLGAGSLTQSMPVMASPSYIQPATTKTSWGQSEVTTTKKSYPAKRKTKYLNRSPVNVRNQIVIANRNG